MRARGDMLLGVIGEDSLPLPEQGQKLNLGKETVPRQAATVMLLRGGAEALEVLLVQRNPQARFMGGVWVFPGGAVEPEEQSSDHPYELAARRELREEAGIELGADAELVQFSRWITPALVETRYDTVFFLAQLPAGQEARVDGNECVEHRWLTPDDALAAYAAGELSLVFPTIKHLQQLTTFASAAELIERSRGKQIGPVQPKVIVESGRPRVVLPGEPGY
jgi:8-oxo-dGTP pyrophosphatase MutT (NUDIX family)